MGMFEDSYCEALRQGLEKHGILLPRKKVLALCAALKTRTPMMFEGPVGTGKTLTAKAIADILGKPLHRITAYPDLPPEEFFGSWDYKRQLLSIQAGKSAEDVFTREYFNPGPALRAVEEDSVLFIDEVNRGGDALQNMILEVAAEGTVTIPRLGTIKGKPQVIVTYNWGDIATTELSHAFKRRFARVKFEKAKGEMAFKILSRKKGIDVFLVADKVSSVLGIMPEPEELEAPPEERGEHGPAEVAPEAEEAGVAGKIQAIEEQLKQQMAWVGEWSQKLKEAEEELSKEGQ